MKALILIILLIPFAVFSQKVTQDFPTDTSFTVYSAFQKIKNQFPDARPVQSFNPEYFLSDLNVIYSEIEGRKIHMDIFSPLKKPGSLIPAVLLIHGGGWRSGNKSHMVPLAQKLAMEGFVTAAVEYRLSAEALYPAGIHDLKEAVKFLKKNASDYNIDSTRIAVLGCSSGATNATFLGTTGSLSKFEDKNSGFQGISAKVQAIINIDGIIDFTDPAESGKDNNPAKPSAGAYYFGGTYKQIPEKWIEASPVNYAGAQTPSILFINSSLPRYHAGRDELIENLKQFNIFTDVHTIMETPHPFWLFYPWFNETENLVVNFLREIF
ncbi:MAG: alpha/beta hydrolase [Mariniphaga sp.]|nr:alpha/beta hydrolase [Mariniphaga sp.]